MRDFEERIGKDSKVPGREAGQRLQRTPNPDRSPTKGKAPVKEPRKEIPAILKEKLTKKKMKLTSTSRASHGVSAGTVTDGEAG